MAKNDSGYCRLCAELKSYSQLIPINKDEESYTSDLIYKVSECLQIKISIDDNLPHTVCMECCTQTDISYQYFQKVHRAQEFLRNIAFNSSLKNNTEAAIIFSVKNGGDESEVIYTDANVSKTEFEQDSDPQALDTFPEEACDEIDNAEIDDNVQSRSVGSFEKDFPDFSWLCNECSEISKSRNELIRHFETIHNKLPTYSCNECDLTFVNSDYAYFTQHVREHKHLFSCEICGRIFRGKNTYRKHMRVAHKQNLNICPICSKQFKWPSNVDRHLRNVHGIGESKIDKNEDTENNLSEKDNIEESLVDNNSQPSEISPEQVAEIPGDSVISNRKTKLIRTKDGSLKRVFPRFEEEYPNYKWRCNICSNILKSKKQLLQHSKREHKKLPEYTCNICNKVFSCNGYKCFTRHVRQHSSHFPCHLCRKVFNWKPLLQKHITYAHEQKSKYICSICSKEFKRQTSLKRHEQIHQMGSNRLKYECDICHKMILSEKTLEIHKQVHDESTKRYTCEKCGLTFRLKDTLETHIKNIHTFIPQEKYPECPICFKKLKHEKQVRRHIRYIHSQKRFECETCGKQFFLLTHYKNHLTLHTGELPFECEYCKKRFRIKKGLMQHILQHTGEKPYCCFDCSHDFTDFSNYIKHMRRKHGVTSFKGVKKVSELNRTDVQNALPQLAQPDNT